jgi:O-antigen/teichoic acid export membrane protein
MKRLDYRAWTRERLITASKPFVWGFASQVASSITNFSLSLVAARLLGPSGLGSVFIGFSYYLIILGFQRALITDPLVAISTSLPGRERSVASSAALTTCMILGSLATLLLVSAAYLLPSMISDGMLPFSVWLLPALVQDFWRVVLFRDRRGKAAALNDAAWAIIMVLTISLPLSSRSAWGIVAWWGIGALGGTLLGLLQTHCVPQGPWKAIRWWWQRAWSLGRWLGAGGIIYTFGSQSLPFLLAPVIGTASLGGLRGGQVLFGPLTLLIPALSMPAFPEISRRLSTSLRAGIRFAVRVSILALVLTIAYLSLAVVGGGRLLTLVFGQSFASFSDLIVPVGFGQVFIAATIGLNLQLKAQERGVDLLVCSAVSSVSSVGLSLGLAVKYGVSGAAWGMALGSSISAAATAWFALARPRR